ncbi:MAG: response regulator, partial [Deltaproteobacteria bacterium]|nr:response regulator [Deltaproteobacteria bacterium]
MADKVHILIVDDSRHTRKLFTDILEGEGYATSMASDGVEALQFLSANEPDLILLDMVMPRMDGLATLAQMRRMGMDSKVILITSITQSAVIASCMKHGVNEFIVKPINKEELLAKISFVLGGPSPAVQENSMSFAALFVGRERVAEEVRKMVPGNIHLECCSGKRNAERICADQRFDRIILGSLHPPTDVLPLLKELRAVQPSASIHVVYLRSELNPGTRCVSDGFDGFLLKPLSKSQVSGVLDTDPEIPKILDIEDYVIELSPPQPGGSLEMTYFEPMPELMRKAVNQVADAQFDCVVFDVSKAPLTSRLI